MHGLYQTLLMQNDGGRTEHAAEIFNADKKTGRKIKNMKKIVAIVTAAVMTMSLAACGSNTASKSAASAAASAPAASESAEATEEAVKEETAAPKESAEASAEATAEASASAEATASAAAKN